MNPSTRTEDLERIDTPSADGFGIIDPRSKNDFDPSFYPKADGALPPGREAKARDERIKREFCAVYYQLNKLHARLMEVRRQPHGRTGQDWEREVMREIEKNLQIRDSLEDRYAPYGVIAEAIAWEGFTIDIQFTFGDDTELRRQRTQLISSTALLFFPKPENSGSREAV